MIYIFTLPAQVGKSRHARFALGPARDRAWRATPDNNEDKVMQQHQSVAAAAPEVRRNLKTIAQTPDVRIVEYTLSPGASHPWHHHSEVTDRIYCLEGLIGVDIRQPEQQFRLRPGEGCEVPVGRVHHVSNPGSGTSRYLLIQALGRYDYIRAD